MNPIARAWRGEERCWKVFWIYGIVGTLAWLLLVPQMSRTAFVPGWVFAASFLGYQIWLLVSQYRCAFNLGWRFFGYLVRVWTVVVPLVLGVGILSGGIMKGHRLVQQEQCRKVMADPVYRAAHQDQYRRCEKEAEPARPPEQQPKFY